MLMRCYSIRHHQTCPNYIGCSVCPEWLYLSNFKEWFDANYVDGYALDKDIIIKGNKTYSPHTCCFVPQEINNQLIKSDAARGKCPIGVSQRGSRYYAKFRSCHLGVYTTSEAAFLAYKKAKEQYVMELAEKYYKEGKITERVYHALLAYRVEITD